MALIRDMLGNYRITGETTDADILQAAEDILHQRLQRQGGITRPSDAADLLKARLGAKVHEVFCVIFLDTRHRIIAVEDLFHGTIDGAEVHCRVIAKRALELNAAALIVAHNHPSGEPEPSRADRVLTDRIKDSMALLDIRVLDHLVVGSTVVSMAERGWL